jgi:hypothetical protein
MRSGWVRSIACSLAQIASLAGIGAWIAAAEVVPYRGALVWTLPALGAWAGLAAASALACAFEWRRLRREVRLSIRWEDVEP